MSVETRIGVGFRFFPDDIPTVETIRTAVGECFARLDGGLGVEVRDEMRDTAAIRTDNRARNFGIEFIGL